MISNETIEQKLNKIIGMLIVPAMNDSLVRAAHQELLDLSIAIGEKFAEDETEQMEQLLKDIAPFSHRLPEELKRRINQLTMEVIGQ